MTRPVCESIRDLLPELVANRLDAARAARAEAHLRDCADCRIEREIVAGIAAERIAVPPELEGRVLAAARRTHGRRPRRSVRYALAAGVAAAALTGGLLLRGRDDPPRPDANLTVAADAAVEEDLDLAGMDGLVLPASDPLLQGGALQELSVDELETLLKELGS